jgi:hypothetical protein
MQSDTKGPVEEPDGGALDPGGVHLSGAQVDLLVQALLSDSQPRKGRRAFLVKMLGRSPDGGLQRQPEGSTAKAAEAGAAGGVSVEEGADRGAGRTLDGSLLQDAREQEKLRERELRVLRGVGLVGCGES